MTDTPLQIKTIDDAKKLINERGLNHVKVAITDIDGVMRGKYMGKDKFFSALDKGFGFCDVVFGWDSNDVLYPKDSFTGWATAFPDSMWQIRPETARECPLEGDGMVIFLAQALGRVKGVDPRSILDSVVQRAGNMGYDVNASVEFEFFMFNETPESVRTKNYKNLQNMTPDPFGYSVLRMTTHDYFYRQILEMCKTMNIPLEGLHTETGAGVLEAAIQYCGALEAADRGVLFKTYLKALAQNNGMMATFMAKYSHDWPGQSGHIHTSLVGKNGKSAFYDDKKEYNMTDTMRWYVGGQQKLMPKLLAMIASNVNSYTRLIPGYWAPTSATWGYENRTCALRVIGGSPHSQRVEYRIAAADINPYLALSCAIGSGLYGIEHKIEPTAPITGNAYTAKIDSKLTLPMNLWEAAQRLKQSKEAIDLFGKEFVNHYAYTREHEYMEGHKAITDWQLKRYFEII